MNQSSLVNHHGRVNKTAAEAKADIEALLADVKKPQRTDLRLPKTLSDVWNSASVQRREYMLLSAGVTIKTCALYRYDLFNALPEKFQMRLAKARQRAKVWAV